MYGGGDRGRVGLHSTHHLLDHCPHIWEGVQLTDEAIGLRRREGGRERGREERGREGGRREGGRKERGESSKREGERLLNTHQQASPVHTPYLSVHTSAHTYIAHPPSQHITEVLHFSIHVQGLLTCDCHLPKHNTYLPNGGPVWPCEAHGATQNTFLRNVQASLIHGDRLFKQCIPTYDHVV